MYIMFQYIYIHITICKYTHTITLHLGIVTPIYNENKKARRWITHCSPLWPPGPKVRTPVAQPC